MSLYGFHPTVYRPYLLRDSMVDLDLPQQVVCPLCRSEKTTLEENNAGNPMFRCQTFNSVHNLRPPGDDARKILADLAEDDTPEGDDSELEDSGDGSESEGEEPNTLADLLNTDDT